METIDERTFKQKVHDTVSTVKQKVEDGAKAVGKTVKEHPVESFTLACIALPGVLKCANSAIRASQASKEARYNECDYYDPRTGEHWYTRKPLTANQKLNLEQRYKLGESKGSILRDMKMI